ncbi:Helix-turn-helix domain-containing protein [Dyadobacter soli]|uniref:Helix-turn-helix domain-containing protein n=2 Tax=Dyadobacter soli TaxID=659014 RepID=A0A1G8BSM5_9BACT|nr:Helix-turn-helix domain-containing protein [Dyadobacter soli]
MVVDVLIINVKQAAMEKKGKQTEESSALYAHQLVTLADLEKFKEQMLSEMRRLLAGGGAQHSKQWLKSREVRKLLDISPGKLHAMRLSRQLSFMRIGGVIYYDRADIDKMFEKFKTAAVK